MSRTRARYSPAGEGTVELFISCPRQQEDLLAIELAALGASQIKLRHGGVQCPGDLGLAYRICFASRLASRVLWPLAAFRCTDADSLYTGTAALPWPDLILPDATLAVGFNGVSKTLRHTGFSAQRCKDAIVDTIRSAGRPRPDVDPKGADVRLQGVLHRDRVTLYLDLSGDALHRRGWRDEAGTAPLKENLAAALLLRGGWQAGSSDWLVDPMCGSGTLLVEGALIAAGIAPGHLRAGFGFHAWTGHRQSLFDETRAAFPTNSQVPVRLFGRDLDPAQVERTHAHLEAAGNGRDFTVELDLATADIRDLNELPTPLGLIVSNPPYGSRLKAGDALPELGRLLTRHARGVPIALLIGTDSHDREHHEADLTIALEQLQLPGHEALPCRNGPLPTWMLSGTVPQTPPNEVNAEALAHATMFANRLRKNAQRLGRWARRQQTSAYRVYDRDLPEYGLVIDRYDDAVCVQEIAPPAHIDPVLAARRRDAALHWIPESLEVAADAVFFRERRRQDPTSQYGVLDHSRAQRVVQEGDARLLVNLSDYLDTGLYLDSRGVRRLVSEHFRRRPGNGRFLNLFAYTGSASVQAALAGASQTLSVDLSNTYLDWMGANLQLNKLDGRAHRRVRADVSRWLEDAGPSEGRFSLILLDAPTFSNSKRTRGDLDIQRDHPALLNSATALLEPGGVLLFVTHARKFRWQASDLEARLEVREITERTLDPDCSRGRPAHRSWSLQAPA